MKAARPAGAKALGYSYEARLRGLSGGLIAER
jgi:hypothetical protein